MDRVNLGVFALHPEMAGYAVVWEPELDEAIEIAVRREDMDTPMYLNSPIHWLVERGGSFVADLRRPEKQARFAVFEEFSERGFEAYFGERIDYGDGGVAVLSVCSRRADRFDEAQVEGLRAVFPALKLFIHLVETRRLAETVLETYLGPDTSKRVLSGQILRGQGESIEAALWLCDLRGFTQLTSSLSSAELIQVMNDYFDAMAEAVWSHGGEILKFMGDAMLVVFRIDDQRSARARVGKRSPQGRPPSMISSGSRDGARRKGLRRYQLESPSTWARSCMETSAPQGGWTLPSWVTP